MNIKKLITAGILAVVAMVAVAEPAVTDLVAKQRFPWNGKVDISYTLTEDLPESKTIKIYAYDLITGVSYIANATALSGHTGNAKGVHNIVWDLDRQGLELKSSKVEFTVVYEESYPLYCVVNLSGSKYSVSYMDSPPSGGFNTASYKTDNIALRLIRPGTFKMCGSDRVTITKPFYCGIFEVTHGQYDNVGTTRPESNWDNLSGISTCPLECVRYSDIRGSKSGSGWPSSSAVDENSFMGVFRARTGLDFDLPTEAQWEYACRAGTTTDYNSGKNCTGDECPNMDEVGIYWCNRGMNYSKTYTGMTTVGSRAPNIWGLYDMHGNVSEWCLDWKGSLDDGIDPVGPSTGSKRVLRGGSWGHSFFADKCTSSSRSSRDPSEDMPLNPATNRNVRLYYHCGFRIARTLPADVCSSTIPIKIDTVTMSSFPVVESLPIPYNSTWVSDNPNAVVVITDNGREIKRVTGAGEFTYIPSGACRHDLAYTTYVDGIAQGEVLSATVYATWTQYKFDIRDGASVITEMLNTSSEVTIPEEIDGYPVKEIKGNVLANNNRITSIAIPNSVTNIGDNAFSGCSGLRSVTIPSSVPSIGSDIFRDCERLTNVTISVLSCSSPLKSVFPSIYTNITTVIIADSVTSIGASAFYNCNMLRSVTIPDSVTSIGAYAFYNCNRLTSVTIPDSVTSIGAYAFYNCFWLTNVTIGNGVTSIGAYAFYKCNNLTSVTIPDSVKSIGDYAFYSTDLKGMTIPGSVTSIGNSAFYCCFGLTNVTIGNGVTSIGAGAFSGCSGLTSVTIPDSVTSIGKSAFNNCKKLASVTIGNGVTNIGSSAFSGCRNLTSVTIGNGVTSIGDSAFYHCAFRSVTIPDCVTRIGDDAFQFCDGLTSVTIPDSVTSIGNGAFDNCGGLKSVTIGNGVKSIGDYAFYACPFLERVNINDIAKWCEISFGNPEANPLRQGNLYLNGSLVKSVMIPDSATNVGNYAFYSYDNLTSVTIPDSVTSIGAYAFYNCNKLTSVTIPDSVKSIGDHAFYDCSALTSMTIGNGVTSIGEYAFSCCSGLERVYVSPVNVDRVKLLLTYSGLTVSRIDFVEVGVAVAFDANGGSVDESVRVVLPGCAVGELPVPVRSVGTFAGWWTSIDDGVQVDESTKVMSNVTYYAHWDGIYRVTFDQQGGSGGTSSVAVPYGDAMPSITVPTRADCVFGGYYTAPYGGGTQYYTEFGESACTWDKMEAATLYAKWIGIYTVAFDRQGGSGGTLSVRATYGRAMPSITVPTRADCVFGGYYTAPYGGGTQYYTEFGESACTWDKMEAATLYAKWIGDPYVVTLDQQNGSGGTVSVTANYAGAMPAIVVPTRPGYRFDGYWIGWNGNGTQYYNASGESAHEWDMKGEATLYAKWTAAETCPVTLDHQGGSGGTANVTATYGSVMPPITMPTRTGYTFGGYWSGVDGSGTQYYTSSGVSVCTWDKVAGTTTLYAKWIANTYDVTFDHQGGSGGTVNVTATYGSAMSSITVPTRTGYTFGGYWAGVDGSGTQYYAADGSCVCVWNNADAATLYAKWQVNQYTVKFNANGGEGTMSDQVFAFGEPDALDSNVFVCAYHDFSGWATNETDAAVFVDGETVENLTAVDGRVVDLYATWTRRTRTVRFYRDKSFDPMKLIETRIVGEGLAVGEMPDEPTAPEGCYFAGWREFDFDPKAPIDSNTIVDRDMEICAIWGANVYTVTFDANGGDGGVANEQEYDSDIVTPTVTREGYTFVGWSPDIPATVPASNVTYIALWKINQYSVTFDANGGNGGTSVTLDYGAVLAAPTVTRDGYTFAGWLPVVPATVPAANVTYTAKWQVNKYKVTFDANGGSVDESSRRVVADSTVGTLPTPTRTGYSFAGWWTSATGGAQIYASTKITGAVTYYAHWAVNQCQVTFNANGGSVIEASRMVAEGCPVGTLPTPTRSGYIFDGWFAAESGGMQISASTVISCAVTYYAHWTWTDQPILTIDPAGVLTGVDLNGYTDIVIPVGVTSIGSSAFKGCGGLASVTIPNSVTSIGAGAFEGCSGLEEITLPFVGACRGDAGRDDSLFGYIFGRTSYTGSTKTWQQYSSSWYAYYIPSSLRRVVVTGETVLGYGAFSGCSGLTSVTIPDSVTSIGSYAFSGCSLSSITIPSSVAVISESAFSECGNLKSVTIKEGVSVIGDDAFRACGALKTINLPSSVRIIGDTAFANSGLTSMTLPQGVGNIGYATFANCLSLASVTVPSSVKSIEYDAFVYCSALKAVTYLGSCPDVSEGEIYYGTPTSLVSYVPTGDATWAEALAAGTWMDRAIKTGTAAKTYTVQFHKYDGSGATRDQVFKVGETKSLLWMDSQLKWTREGYEFIGWVPWNPDSKARLCKYVNGQKVKDLAKEGETVHLWAAWKSQSSYRVCFNRNDGSGEKMNQVILRNKEDTLAWLDSQLEWTRPGYTFKGWAESATGAVKYANGAKVKNLAMNGGTKNLYAVWAGKQYKVQYHKYDGSGATLEQTFTMGKAQRLLWMDSQLHWMRDGYEFVGWVPWNPDSKARLCRYANGQEVKDIAVVDGKFTETVHLWCGWKSSSSYRVCFNKNDGSGAKLNQVILRNKEDTLAWLDSQLEWTREGYTFQGWAETASGAVKYANGAKVKNLAMNGGTKNLYAIWKAVKKGAKMSAFFEPVEYVAFEERGELPGMVVEGETADGDTFRLVVGEGGAAVLYLFDGEGWSEERCEVAAEGGVIAVAVDGGMAYRVTLAGEVPLLE